MIRFRAQPLISAAWFALAFVALRVVYRGLFNGLNRGGQVLLDLPSRRLPEPINHVVLLGPITTEGLTIAVRSALPIALIILGFGLINAILNVPGLVARVSHRGPVRAVAQALVIAWATLPSLTTSVRDVRRARSLRGERGLAALLVPVMEQTLERAVALGTSMEVRGFAADPAPSPRPRSPATVRFDGVTLSYGSSWRLQADFELMAGQLAVLTGPTGSGKSTLLHAISGLHSHVYGGTLTGALSLAGIDRGLSPHRTAHLVGVVAQQPRLSFTSESVREEIGFASRVQGAPRADIERRVLASAERVGVTHLLDAATATLSAGQAHLVAIAAAIAHEPLVLLADEPLADLAPPARRRVPAPPQALADQGLTVLVAEHRTTDLLAASDVVLTLLPDGDDRLRVDVTPAPHTTSEELGSEPVDPEPAEPAPASTSTAVETGSVVAEARGLRVAFGGHTVIAEADLTLHAGEIVAVMGDIGSGKTSLLQAMALPSAGVVTVAGIDVASQLRAKRVGSLALVPDLSDDLLFALTLEQECARADHVAHRERGTTERRFGSFLGLSAPSAELRSHHPRDLSVGQRRLLVIALQLSHAPRAPLIDEPSRGLDPSAAQAVRRALLATAKSGTAVLLATHDPAFAAMADRRLLLADGVLRAEVPA